MTVPSVTDSSMSLIQAWLQSQRTSSVTGTSATSETSETQGAPPPPPPDGSRMSELGQFLSKLENLSSTDPEQFKELAAAIALKLEEASKDATGRDAEMLADLASRFREASESGTTESIQPPPPPSGPPPNGYEKQARESEDLPSTAGADQAGSREALDAVWKEILELVNNA